MMPTECAVPSTMTRFRRANDNPPVSSGAGDALAEYDSDGEDRR